MYVVAKTCLGIEFTILLLCVEPIYALINDQFQQLKGNNSAFSQELLLVLFISCGFFWVVGGDM